MSDIQTGDPVLQTFGISKRFGGVHALERVDFSLRAGEVVALAGDNGAGKSTFTKIISGVFRPSEGEIRYCGQPVSFDGPQAARTQGIETIYQDLALADNLDIGGNVFLGRELKTKFLFLPRIDRKRMREEAAKAISVLDVHLDRLDRPVRALSGGQRQAVAIGRAIHWDARVLIMDEPTAALGVPEQRKVMDLIRSLKTKGHRRHLHLAQPRGHVRGQRPHRRASPRRGLGRAEGGRCRSGGDRAADGGSLKKGSFCFFF